MPPQSGGGRGQPHCSATAIYRTFLERRPELAEELFGEFADSIGDEVGTDAPYYMLPVFTMQGGATSDLSRVYIDQAQAFPEYRVSPIIRPKHST